jgi:hypothetical protein
MKILKRSGNEFRDLSYDEYKAHRINDGDFSPSEKHYFSAVIKFCKSADTAKCFSDAWDF